MNRSSILNKLFVTLFAPAFIISMQLPAFAQTDTGIELYNYWEFKKAEDAFKKALEDDPGDTKADYYLGLSFLMQKKYSDALDTLKKIDKTGSPDRGRIKIALTRVYLGQKNLPEAMKCLKEAEKAKADPVDIHTFKGAYLLAKGDTEKAVKELDKAIELKSMNPYTYYHAGFAYLKNGDAKAATKLFEAFLQLAPYAPEAANVKFLIDSLC